MILGYWRPTRVFARIDPVVRASNAVPAAKAIANEEPPPEPRHNEVYNLPGQERLLALARHKNELERAEQKLRLAYVGGFDKDVREALVESAISTYISCFNSKITGQLSPKKVFSNKPTLKSFHKLIDSLRNKVIDHGDMTYHTAHLGVAVDKDSRVEYLNVFYVSMGEWLNARDTTKFFVLVRYVKKWVSKSFDEELGRITAKFKGTVLDKHWHVGPILIVEGYQMLSELRITSRRKLCEEAELDDTDSDIQITVGTG